MDYLRCWFAWALYYLCQATPQVLLRRPRFFRCRGRHDDWSPWICYECGWAGPLRWAIHDYQNDGSDEEVEAVDLCPRCGQDQLEPAEYSRR